MAAGKEAIRRVPKGFAQVESSASRTLQMLLHFNVYLSVIFFVLETVILARKLGSYELDVFGKVLAPLTFGVWSAAEVARLWFGYSGNLQEKLPQTAVFFLVSIFPQLPCLVYIMHLQSLLLPAERVMGWSIFVLTVLELFLAYFAISTLIKKQTITYSRLVNNDDDYGGDDDDASKGDFFYEKDSAETKPENDNMLDDDQSEKPLLQQ